MPFQRNFNDVYTALRLAIGSVPCRDSVECFRLDDLRPAGRITDRLLAEIASADLCISDLTGANPNVMWETGYAMALSKPLLIITQDLKELPFDLKDMQSIEYDRNHLNETLSLPLTVAMKDTIDLFQEGKTRKQVNITALEELVSNLRGQIAELKSIVIQAVQTRESIDMAEPRVVLSKEARKLAALEGVWVSEKEGGTICVKSVNGVLLGAYDYNGNEQLTGCCYHWIQMEDGWFHRFKWIYSNMSGFAFLKQPSPRVLSGAWWIDDPPYLSGVPDPPPESSGAHIRWKKKRAAEFPDWARWFFDEAVRHKGVLWF